MTIEKWEGSRHWAVFDEAGDLICLCVYKKGAVELVRRLLLLQSTAANKA